MQKIITEADGHTYAVIVCALCQCEAPAATLTFYGEIAQATAPSAWGVRYRKIKQGWLQIDICPNH